MSRHPRHVRRERRGSLRLTGISQSSDGRFDHWERWRTTFNGRSTEAMELGNAIDACSAPFGLLDFITGGGHHEHHLTYLRLPRI